MLVSMTVIMAMSVMAMIMSVMAGIMIMSMSMVMTMILMRMVMTMIVMSKVAAVIMVKMFLPKIRMIVASMIFMGVMNMAIRVNMMFVCWRVQRRRVYIGCLSVGSWRLEFAV